MADAIGRPVMHPNVAVDPGDRGRPRGGRPVEAGPIIPPDGSTDGGGTGNNNGGGRGDGTNGNGGIQGGNDIPPQDGPGAQGGLTPKQSARLEELCLNNPGFPRCALLNPDPTPTGGHGPSKSPQSVANPTAEGNSRATTERGGIVGSQGPVTESVASGGSTTVGLQGTAAAQISPSNDDGGISTGALAAAVVVPVVVVIALIGFVFFWLRRRRNRSSSPKTPVIEKSQDNSPTFNSSPPMQQSRNVSSPMPLAGSGAVRTDFSASNRSAGSIPATAPPQYSKAPPGPTTKSMGQSRSPFADPSASQSSGFLGPIAGVDDGKGLMDISPQEAAAVSSPQQTGYPAATAVAKIDRDRDDDEVSAVSDDEDATVEYGEAGVTSVGAQQRASVIDMGLNSSSGRLPGATSSSAHVDEEDARRELHEEPPRW